MDNNKLIAEFMELKESSVSNKYWTEQSKDGFGKGELVELQYHTSWDWLMPVVLECFNKQEKVTDDLSFKLNDALLETNINSLYQVVVEFINEYNK
jgi:hypothetical protein